MSCSRNRFELLDIVPYHDGPSFSRWVRCNKGMDIVALILRQIMKGFFVLPFELIGRTPDMVFFCCSPSSSRFDMLSIKRLYSTCCVCNKCIFDGLSPSFFSNQSALLPMTADISEAFFSQLCPSLDIFLC